MKKIKTIDVAGMVLCYDVTKIVPGEFKGAAFKKGHVVQAVDIEELLKMGKEHLYVWESDENSIHENEAAIRISHAVAGTNIVLTEPQEGKVNLKDTVNGLLKINIAVLEMMNDIDEVALATRHNNSAVEQNTTVAGCRVIPLVIKKEKIEQVEQICAASAAIITVKPFRPLKTGLITTGNEVYTGCKNPTRSNGWGF